jgi:hypothetical protein
MASGSARRCARQRRAKSSWGTQQSTRTTPERSTRHDELSWIKDAGLQATTTAGSLKRLTTVAVKLQRGRMGDIEVDDANTCHMRLPLVHAKLRRCSLMTER